MVGLEYFERYLEERKLEIAKELNAKNIIIWGDEGDTYVSCEIQTPGYDEAKKKHEDKRLWNRFLKLIGKRR